MFPLSGGTVSVVWQWVASSSGFYNAAEIQHVYSVGKWGFCAIWGIDWGSDSNPFLNFILSCFAY